MTTDTHIIYDCIVQTLSPDSGKRQQAEAALASQAANSAEFPLALLRIISGDGQVPPEHRQLAIFVLKSYIDSHWSSMGEKFVAGSQETPAEVKDQVKLAILPALQHAPTTKIQNALALVVSRIASHDWPERWPQLFDSLMAMLKSGQAVAVNGALRVLSDFVDDMSDQQFPQMAAVMVPELYNIFVNRQSFPSGTRAQALIILRACLDMCHLLKDHYPHDAHQLFQQYMMPWMPAILEELKNVTSLNSDELLMKVEVATTIINILQQFPAALHDSLNLYIMPTLSVVCSIVDRYVRINVQGGDAREGESDDDCPISNVIYVFYELLGSLASQRKLKAEFSQHIAIIIDTILKSAQITVEQEEDWSDDCNQFIANEDESSINISVRSSAGEVIYALVKHHGVSAVNVIIEKFISLMQQSNPLTEANWKPIEASFLIFGGISDSAVDLIESGKLNFDLFTFFEQMISPLLTVSNMQYLKARALWLVGKFSHTLPHNVASKYCEFSVQILHSDQESAVVKICAMKALQQFSILSDSPIQQNNYHVIVGAILKFLPVVSDDILLLSLETLTLVLKKCSGVSADLANDVTQTLVSTWTHNTNDQIVASSISEIVDLFSEQDVSYSSVARVLFPAIIQIVTDERPVDQTADLRCIAIDFLNSAIKHGRSSPVELQEILPQIVSLGLSPQCSNSDILQRIQTFCKFVVSKYFNIVLNLVVPPGNGLDLLFAFLHKMLDVSQTSEEAALNTGDIISKILLACNAEQLNAVVPKLVPAIINRLSSCSLHTSIQNYCTNICILILNDANAVIEFLNSFHVNGNRSALEVFLTAWSDSFEFLNGFFVTQVNICALTRVLMTANVKLNDIIVKGEKIVDATEAGVIMTRSRRRQVEERWTNLPFPVKAVKILLQHYKENVDLKPQQHDMMSGENTETMDDEDSWEDDSIVESDEDEYEKFDSMLAAAGGDMEHVEEDDEMVKNHPVYSMDILSLIKDFFKQFHQKYPEAFLNIVNNQLDQQQIETVQILMTNQ